MSDTNISTEDLELLRLLLSGLRDDEVAGRLFMSVRTMRRRVEGLMARTGSATRFALGAHAAALGWIHVTQCEERSKLSV